jgi:preprotein translocase subunit SecY
MSIQTAAGTSKFVGAVPGLISSLITGNYYLALLYLTPILTTAIIFFVVLYVSAIHVDIPLAFSSLRGFGRTWSLKFLYASVIPVIFISALLANVQVMGQIGAHPTDDGGTCGPLGCFNSQKSPTSGVVYYLTSPHSLVSRLESSVGMPSTEILRAFTYVIFLCVGAMIFSIFWVSTSGMDAKSVANQLEGSGMQIPGYRRDPRIMESVLNRYIPALTVLGGIAIGLLAAGADFLGAIGSGTGILLTTMIITDLYERLRHENIEEAHPVIRKLIGE